MIITALLPHIGYDKATELVQQFAASAEENVVAFLRGKLGDDLVASVFSARNLVALGYKDTEIKGGTA